MTQTKPTDGLTRYVHVVRPSFGTKRRRPASVALRAALQQAWSRPRLLRGRSGAPAAGLPCDTTLVPPHPQRNSAREPGFAPGERGTLELGSVVVLGALGLGIQFGRWSAWSALIAIGGYLTWVVTYSEVTVQAGRLRSRDRSRSRPGSLSADAPPLPPG